MISKEINVIYAILKLFPHLDFIHHFTEGYVLLLAITSLPCTSFFPIFHLPHVRGVVPGL